VSGGAGADLAPPLWVARAPAKINLGLFVGPVRPDGRHELASVMQSISLSDELTLEPASGGAESDEVVCPGVVGENLASRALSLFRCATGWAAGPMRLRIDKRVPVAAGLGGGSGDAAAALRLASAASGLGDEALLLELARELGADVSAQVSPGRWLATGAGERLERLADPTDRFGVLVLADPAELSAAHVYAQADLLAAPRAAGALEDRARDLRDALGSGTALPHDAALLHNDLAEAAVSLCPSIEQSLARAREVGADEVLVSGSGPTVIGLFRSADRPSEGSAHARDGLARARDAGARLAGREPPAVVATPVERSFATAHRPSVRNNAGSKAL
jgi:4-diphosphocytidyl-2-C-methyl-D-erythritol kinase